MDTLHQYRIFLQVAEMGSFIKAAHALDVPRPSVSAAVQQLESVVGTRLLHRTTRQVRLTAVLRRYPKLQLTLGSTDRAIDLVQEGVDCAIRVGSLNDSRIVARPPGRLALINCASPAYLTRA